MSYQQKFTNGIFGDGSDGDVSISATTTLTRDMYYETLTITSTGILNTASYGVFARKWIRIDSGGRIASNGGDAVDTFTPGAGSPITRFQSGSNQGVQSDIPFDGNASNPMVYAALAPRSGGSGGGTSFALGGAGGVEFPMPAASGSRRIRQTPTGVVGYGALPAHNSAIYNNTSGGGSGGGNGTDYGGNAGGGGGGFVAIITPSLYVDGTIQAIGGAGQPANSVGTGEIGGGGGGAGGIAMLACRDVYDVNANYDFALGTGGPGQNGGVDGSDGDKGTSEKYVMGK